MLVVGVVMIPSCTTTMMIVGGYCMGDEMEEGISQEAARGEAEKDFEERGVLRGTVKRDEEENEERGSTNESSGDKSIGPQLHGILEW